MSFCGQFHLICEQCHVIQLIFRFVELKRLYYLSVAYLYLGMQSDEAQRMGERVTYYQVSFRLSLTFCFSSNHASFQLF